MLFCCFLVLTLFSCELMNKRSSTNHQNNTDSVASSTLVPKTSLCYEIQFLGHQIQYATEDLPQSFQRICAEDCNLDYDSINQNITLYGTTFHLNYRNDGRGFMLMSSVQPDTRQIRIVRDAISKFHGKENFEEDCHYSWLPFTDSTKIGQNYPVIHLRRVRSEEGGTVIIVN